MKQEAIPYKIYLHESELPKTWYNMRADMKKKPAPLLNPATHEPMGAEELAGVFCEELVKQELDDTTAYFEIPALPFLCPDKRGSLRPALKCFRRCPDPTPIRVSRH